MAVTGRDGDDDAPEVPWHNRTSPLLAASVAGLAAIALVVAAISYFVREDEPRPGPLNFVEPAFSATDTATRTTPTTTTTDTITSTSPPVTSDINPDLTPTSTSDSSTSRTTRTPRTKEDDDTTTTRTTRSRPRTNVTRTVVPDP